MPARSSGLSGGKGAGIGAAVGAGVGALGALMTKGNDVQVASGTEIAIHCSVQFRSVEL